MTKPKNTGEMLAAIESLIQAFNLENYHKAVEYGVDKTPLFSLSTSGVNALGDLLGDERIKEYTADYLKRRRHLAGEIMDLYMEE